MQNRKWTWAVALSAVVAPLAMLMAPAGASGNVPRYEIQTLTFTVDLHVGGGYIHNFTATLNPCDGTFSGTGVNTSDGNKQETVTGTYSGGELSYTAVQNQGAVGPPPWSNTLPWGTVSPVAIDSSGAGGPAAAWAVSAVFTTSWDITISDVAAVNSSDLTHGQFVSQGLAAPDSCLGMPMTSQR